MASKSTKARSRASSLRRAATRKSAVRPASSKAGSKRRATRPVTRSLSGAAARPAKPAASPKPPRGLATVKAYLEALPQDRRAVIEKLRAVIRANLDKGMQYGMIGYYIPHSIYPAGYHCDPSQPLPVMGLASQKHHFSMYLMCIYGDEATRAWFQDAWTKTGRTLDMGKGCVRFKRLDDVPLDVLGEAVKRVTVAEFVRFYERALKR